MLKTGSKHSNLLKSNTEKFKIIKGLLLLKKGVKHSSSVKSYTVCLFVCFFLIYIFIPRAFL